MLSSLVTYYENKERQDYFNKLFEEYFNDAPINEKFKIYSQKLLNDLLNYTPKMTNTNKKYFTPKPDDLYIGYECEKLHRAGQFIGESIDTWEHCFITQDNISHLDLEHIKNYIKTPYLNSEQLIKEGWFETSENCFDHPTNERFYLLLYPEDHTLSIGDNESEVGFIGVCPSINEFRLLVKLLNIK